MRGASTRSENSESRLRSTPQRRSSRRGRPRKKTNIGSDGEQYSAASSPISGNDSGSDVSMSDVEEPQKTPKRAEPDRQKRISKTPRTSGTATTDDEPAELAFCQFPSLAEDPSWVFVQQAAAPPGVLRGDEGTLTALEEWGDDNLQCMAEELAEASTGPNGTSSRLLLLRHQLAVLTKKFPSLPSQVPARAQPLTQTTQGKGMKSVPVSKGVSGSKAPVSAKGGKRAPPPPATTTTVPQETTPVAPVTPMTPASDVSESREMTPRRRSDGRVRAAAMAREAKRRALEASMEEEPDNTAHDDGKDDTSEAETRESPEPEPVQSFRDTRAERSERRAQMAEAAAAAAAKDEDEDEDIDDDDKDDVDHDPDAEIDEKPGKRPMRVSETQRISKKNRNREKRRRRDSSDASEAAYSTSDEEKPSKQPQQQAPGLFWQIVEEYFAPLTPETLKILEHRVCAVSALCV